MKNRPLATGVDPVDFGAGSDGVAVAIVLIGGVVLGVFDATGFAGCVAAGAATGVGVHGLGVVDTTVGAVLG